MNRSRTAVRRSAAAALAAGVLALAAAAPGTAAGPGVDPRNHEPYTVMNDYVRVLVYWHHHPTWGLPPKQ